MKSIYKTLGNLSTFLYIAGILSFGYYIIHNKLYDNPTLKNFFTSYPGVVYYTIAIIFIGLLGLLFLTIGGISKIDVVYVKDDGQTNEGKNLSDKSSDENSKETLQNTGFSTSDVEKIILTNQHNKKNLLEQVLQSICKTIEASIGELYILKESAQVSVLEMTAGYAYYNPHEETPVYELGHGLIGQVAKNKKSISIDSIPDGYIKVISGLGAANPTSLLIYPILNEENDALGVLEVASFKKFSEKENRFLKEMASLLAKEIENKEYHNISL